MLWRPPFLADPLVLVLAGAGSLLGFLFGWGIRAAVVGDRKSGARLAAELRARNAELEAAAAAVARENAFLDAVLAQMPAAVMIVAPDGRILRRNERHEQLWGPQASIEQLNQLASGAFSRSHTGKLPFESWPIVRAISDGETTHGFEVRLAHATDPAEWLDVSIGAGPVVSAGREVLGAVAVMTDVTERKATLASLRESEARFRIALSAARMLTYEWDTTARTFRTGEPLRPWCGLDAGPEPASLADLADLIHPEDHESLRHAVAAVVGGGTRCETEFRIRRPDGSSARLMSRSTRLPEPDGRLSSRVVGIFVDITDRQRNEDRLRLLESAVVHARDAVVILESEPERGLGRSVLYTNDAFCQMTGYSAGELIGRSLHFLRGPRSDPATLERLREALAGGTTFQGELLNYRKDGTEYWAELSVVPVPDRDGRCAHFVMIQRDVSDRKRAEDDLRRSEQLLSDAQRIAHIGSWEYDVCTHDLRWSAEEYRIFGRDPAEFVLRPDAVQGCVHPDDWAAVTALFADVLEHPTARAFEYRVVRPGGEVRFVRDQVIPVCDGEGGRLLRLYGVTHDVTESRRAQEQLAQAQKMELIGQMAGGIAHDFNNILTAIIGNLARVVVPPAHPAAAMIGVALSAANRAADLTRQLLGFARRHQLLRAPVRAADIVREVVSLIGHSFDPRVRVVLDLDENVSVSADATLMSQVLLNLCVNAKDAMPAGGTLTLRVRAAEVAAPPPDSPAGPYVQWTVEDSGTGMTPEVLSHLFEPFFTTKPVGKGTGLGLAMVHGIMRQHDGWVECHSEVGKGTRFDLYMPLLNAVAPSRVAWSANPVSLTETPLPTPRAATVLLVDDEETIRALGRAVLEGTGYRVLEACDGEDAVATYRANRPSVDLVVLDVTMPRMSGLDAYRILVEEDPGVRVLLSSGYSAESLEGTDGILGLLQKPYQPNDLLNAVGAALARTPDAERATAS